MGEGGEFNNGKTYEFILAIMFQGKNCRHPDIKKKMSKIFHIVFFTHLIYLTYSICGISWDSRANSPFFNPEVGGQYCVNFWNKNKTLQGTSTHYNYVNKMDKVKTVEIDEKELCLLSTLYCKNIFVS